MALKATALAVSLSTCLAGLYHQPLRWRSTWARLSARRRARGGQLFKSNDDRLHHQHHRRCRRRLPLALRRSCSRQLVSKASFCCCCRHLVMSFCRALCSAGIGRQSRRRLHRFLCFVSSVSMLASADGVSLFFICWPSLEAVFWRR